MKEEPSSDGPLSDGPMKGFEGFVRGLLVELAAGATAVWVRVNSKGDFQRVANADSGPGDLLGSPQLAREFCPWHSACREIERR